MEPTQEPLTRNVTQFRLVGTCARCWLAFDEQRWMIQFQESWECLSLGAAHPDDDETLDRPFRPGELVDIIIRKRHA